MVAFAALALVIPAAAEEKAATDKAAADKPAADIAGVWQGTLDVTVAKLRLVIELAPIRAPSACRSTK